MSLLNISSCRDLVMDVMQDKLKDQFKDLKQK